MAKDSRRARRRGRFVVHARAPRLWLHRLVATCVVLLLAVGAGYAGTVAGAWADERIERADVLATTKFPIAGPPAPPPVCTIGQLRKILITGSSTMAAWHESARDLSPMVSENIGVGGTTMLEQLALAKSTIPQKKPDVILLYAGANDVAGGTSPQHVVDEVRQFVAEVHAELPRTVVYFVSVNPTPARLAARAGYEAVNRALADAANADPGGALRFIDTVPALLNPDGSVDPDRFVADGIHLNTEGYEIFSGIVRARLLADGYQYRPCRSDAVG